jgi:hypothetical protein
MAGYPVHLWVSDGDHAGRRPAAGRATRTRYPVHLRGRDTSMVQALAAPLHVAAYLVTVL